MNLLERQVWAAVFGDSFNRYSSMAEPPRAAALGVGLADEAVLLLRERADLGALHNSEDLEAERQAELDLGETDQSDVANPALAGPPPGVVDLVLAAGDRHEAEAKRLRKEGAPRVVDMLAEERALACYQVADELSGLSQSIMGRLPRVEHPELPDALTDANATILELRERVAAFARSRRRWIDAIVAAVPDGWNTPDEATIAIKAAVAGAAPLGEPVAAERVSPPGPEAAGRLRAEALCRAEFAAHVGKILVARTVYGYVGDDFREFHLDPPVRVRVEPTLDEDVTRWCDAWCDPYWDVTLVDRPAELAAASALWVDGPSHAMDGTVGWGHDWTEEASLVNEHREWDRLARAVGWSEAVNCPPWAFVSAVLERRGSVPQDPQGPPPDGA